MNGTENPGPGKYLNSTLILDIIRIKINLQLLLIYPNLLLQ